MRTPLRTLQREARRAAEALAIACARVDLHPYRHFRIRDAALALRSSIRSQADHRTLARTIKQAGYRFDPKTRTWSLPE